MTVSSSAHARPVVVLREVVDDDLPVFFAHMSDPESVRVAAFAAEDPTDRVRFDAHWARIRASGDLIRTVLADGEVAGHAAVYGPPDHREVTYWVDRAHWGRGIATAALSALVGLVPQRPLHARAAADNTGSIRVLQKCGFEIVGHDRGFANARGAEIDEVVLTLAR
ncbi:GNAT family N-acetyltransferase [Streptomyces sp. BPTC-684]|uniref:GNAT family N-acetyltransferase n=1 Tax=Streptomyces sp. BPTC-684 TaxID=3043734 RepID=UPI0024B14165|nr:GNAT family N-acetyltransferase [Streptomyces sp. BPTC-684]WHM39322.1 GNAT family N-acetyltransferase [Streptomyces sp. BPTC-684]